MRMIYYYVLEMERNNLFQLEEEEGLDMVCQMKSIGINQRMKCLTYLVTFLTVYIIYLI